MTTQGSTTVSRRSRSGRQLLPHWIVLALVVLVGLLPAAPSMSAVGDPSTPVPLNPIQAGHPQHVPILMYRQRHSVVSNDVSFERNVAAIEIPGAVDGKTLIMVAPNLSRWGSQTRIAQIDFYLRGPPTGAPQLVGLDLRPLTDQHGKPVNWSSSNQSTYNWDLSTVPDLQSDLRGGRMHSERLLSYFLDRLGQIAGDAGLTSAQQQQLSGPKSRVAQVTSEKIPCDTPPSFCRRRLQEREFFPTAKQIYFITEAPTSIPKPATSAPVQASTSPAQASASPAPTETSGEVIRRHQDEWQKAGMPTGPDAAARMGSRAFTGPGNTPLKGPAAQLVAPGSNLGGVDFSSLELRYLAENQSGLSYSFTASPAVDPDGRAAEGQVAVAQMSDAFFVWLSLAPQTFWVNLNPTEPDRVIDPTLGETDAGRILLEADLELKKTVGRLIHPDTAIGQRFWGDDPDSSSSCLDLRQWIVPGPATVHEKDGGLYLLDTPLKVEMEADYLAKQGAAPSCAASDTRLVEAFHILVLPKVEEAVNKAPEFAELRRVYLSRVAAEWYRQRHGQNGTLAGLIDSGDVSAWPALEQWSPRRVFDQYVDSYQNKEFDVTRNRVSGDTTYQNTYTYGGIDFGAVRFEQATPELFQQRQPELTSTVRQSFEKPATDQRGKIWLGLTSDNATGQDADDSTADDGSPFGTKGVLVVLLSLVGAVVLALVPVVVLRRRRRPVSPRAGAPGAPPPQLFRDSSQPNQQQSNWWDP